MSSYSMLYEAKRVVILSILLISNAKWHKPLASGLETLLGESGKKTVLYNQTLCKAKFNLKMIFPFVIPLYNGQA